MITYITAFIFYTLAMVGILLVGFVIYKKTFIMSKMESKGAIKVIDSYVIAPKKTLLVVKIQNEKFLIASDATSTTFLAKLDNSMEDETEKLKDREKLENLYTKEQAIQKIINEVQDNNNSFKQQFDIENEKYEENNHQDELKKMQSQFMDLYKNNNVSNINIAKKITSKKEVIQKLLQELNDSKTETGSRY